MESESILTNRTLTTFEFSTFQPQVRNIDLLPEYASTNREMDDADRQAAKIINEGWCAKDKALLLHNVKKIVSK